MRHCAYADISSCLTQDMQPGRHGPTLPGFQTSSLLKSTKLPAANLNHCRARSCSLDNRLSACARRTLRLKGGMPPCRPHDDSSSSRSGRNGGSSGGNRVEDCPNGYNDAVELSSQKLVSTLAASTKTTLHKLSAHLRKSDDENADLHQKLATAKERTKT